MTTRLSRRAYAGMYGPTTGDRLRLARPQRRPSPRLLALSRSSRKAARPAAAETGMTARPKIAAVCSAGWEISPSSPLPVSPFSAWLAFR